MMIKNLLLSMLLTTGIGVSANDFTSSDRSSIPVSGSNFRLLSEFFPNYTLTVSGESLIFDASLTYVQAVAKPQVIYDYLFLGDFIDRSLVDLLFVNDGEEDYNYYFNYVSEFNFPFISGYLQDFNDSFYPYLFGRNLAVNIADMYGSYNITLTLEFAQNILPQAKIDEYKDIFINQVGFATSSAIVDYVQQEKVISYQEGMKVADGGWLGNLVFGTIGGMVGFLFAVSDFEVLGVSIMSIITLFVAISILILMMKVLK